MAKYKTTIVECFEVEGEPIKEHGKEYRYFGTSVCTTRSFWPWKKPVTHWKVKFYATTEGNCFSLADGKPFENTTRVFSNYLSERAELLLEDKYVKLLECAKRI